MKTNKAVFLDRDGTLIYDKIYGCNPSEIEILPYVVPSLIKLREAGYLLIIVTNQSGVARGYFTEEELEHFNIKLNECFLMYGISFDKIYYCPHFANGIVKQYAKKCNCRKPKTGLFRQAVKEFNLDLKSCWAIGNNIQDCAICFESECHGCVISATEKDYGANVISCKNFEECANLIIGYSK